MIGFDIRSVIAAWRHWRLQKRISPILAEIAAVTAARDQAKRQHRSVRALDARIRTLKNRQLKLEIDLG